MNFLDIYNGLFQVDFEETFQEPLGSENVSVVWNYNKVIFNWTSVSFFLFKGEIRIFHQFYFTLNL